MKEYILSVIALVAIGTGSALGQLTKAEREYAVDYLKKTQEKLLQTVEGLSEQQLGFKPDDSSWSVAECVEHIALSETFIFGFAETAMKSEANAQMRNEVKFADKEVIAFIKDRSGKVQTGKPLQPQNSFGSLEGSLDAFKSERKAHIKYVKTTKDDLRNHYFDFPFGKADAYQVILFMAGHGERHRAQIEEVMAHADFPKSKL